jgi:hypothetical protein
LFSGYADQTGREGDLQALQIRTGNASGVYSFPQHNALLSMTLFRHAHRSLGRTERCALVKGKH